LRGGKSPVDGWAEREREREREREKAMLRFISLKALSRSSAERLPRKDAARAMEVCRMRIAAAALHKRKEASELMAIQIKIARFISRGALVIVP